MVNPDKNEPGQEDDKVEWPSLPHESDGYLQEQKNGCEGSIVSLEKDLKRYRAIKELVDAEIERRKQIAG